MTGPGKSGLSPPTGDAPENGGAPAWQRLGRFAERRWMMPLEFALGREAVRRYEAALDRLRPRDRQAVLGRIELQLSYGELAEALGVRTAETARASVTRALGRLVEAMSE